MKNSKLSSKKPLRKESKKSKEIKEKPKKKLPVTLLSGFLGSGKTTLLKYILESNEHKFKIAVIVNDMAELNIDANLIKETKLVQAKQELVALQNGCICCTLRADLVREVNRIYEMNTFDYLVIESTGIAEPMQVAESFCTQLDDGEEKIKLADKEEDMLHSFARLDTCVTVLDAYEFRSLSVSLECFKERYQQELSSDEKDTEGNKNLSDLLMEQIEFANVIVINKMDLITIPEAESLKLMIQTLNPKAKIITTSFGKVELHEILGTNSFCLQDAQQAPGWLQSLKGHHHVPETQEYNISSFIYRQRRPFHPARLYDWLREYFILHSEWEQWHHRSQLTERLFKNKSPDDIKDFLLKQEPQLNPCEVEKLKKHGILRSKGFCWIGGRDDIIVEWAHAGKLLHLNPMRPWFATIDESEWKGFQEEEKQLILKDFEDPFGDRRQEIVFIGTSLNTKQLSSELDSCLFTDEELYQHAQSFLEIPDPLPAWPQEITCPKGNSWLWNTKVFLNQSKSFNLLDNVELSLQMVAIYRIEKDNSPEIMAGVYHLWVIYEDDESTFESLLCTIRPGVDQIPLQMIIPGGNSSITFKLTSSSSMKRKFNETYKIEDPISLEVHLMGVVNPIEEEEEDENHDHDHENCHDHSHDHDHSHH